MRRWTIGALVAVTGGLLWAAPVSGAVTAPSTPSGGAQTYDLPGHGGRYSMLDGPESANGAIASLDLAGTWRFIPKGGSPTTIQVPGGGWTKQGFPDLGE